MRSPKGKTARAKVEPIRSDDFGMKHPGRLAELVSGPADVAAMEVVNRIGATMLWRDDDSVFDVMEQFEGGNHYGQILEMLEAAIPETQGATRGSSTTPSSRRST